MTFKLSNYNYTFPPELVAQYPLANREASRMMVVNRKNQTTAHQLFSEIPNYFQKGDVLVLNDSKVFPARLLGQRHSGGAVECFLLREIQPQVWECLLQASKKLAQGEEILLGEVNCEILDVSGFIKKIRFPNNLDLQKFIETHGHVPLPPYISRPDEKNVDTKRYQNVYARNSGSVAAPTAGFHFSEKILEILQEKGVEICTVTLHVGPGTFSPIRVENISEHQMHGEYYFIPEETQKIIHQAKSEKRRVTVVGTTATRALESAAFPKDTLKIGSGYTEIFIYPSYEFKIVDRLLTNFHQPKSSLIVLVSAFAGYDLTMQAYQEAVAKKYRLFSYGDCMLIE